MKEQVQETGVRKWFGDDFINLQTEMNEGAKSPYTDFGSCVISGALVTNNGNGTHTISDGIAYLVNNLGTNGKLCRIYAQTFPAASFPVYLVQASRDKTQVPAYGRLYKDGNNKNVINEYYGSLVTVNPGHVYYLAFTTTTVNKRYRDVIQDVNYRFVTDTEKNTWTAKAPTANPIFTGTVQGVSATMVGLGNVTNESKVTMFTNPILTGNVGIGTATPNATLDVVGKIRTSFADLGLESYISAGGHACCDSIKNDAGYHWFFRMRTSGTPLVVLTMKGDGTAEFGSTVKATDFIIANLNCGQ
jgi:hypothetical protein